MTPQREELLREAVAALRNVTAVMQRVLDEPAGDAEGPDLTTADVAAEQKCSTSQVTQDLRRGLLRGYRVGRRGWRIRRVDLETFKRNRANRRTA